MMWRLGLLSLCFAFGCTSHQTQRSRPQADGEQVARGLNARYDDTRMSCAEGRAAYYCSGVLIRATDAVPNQAAPDRHAWEFSPGSGTPEGLSFSYLRSDVDSRILYGPQARPHGLLVRQAEAIVAAPGTEPVTVLCSFPYDAITGARDTTGDPAKGSNGCGASSAYVDESKPCKAQGIETAEAWRKHFKEVTSFPGQFNHQCGFGNDQQQFALSIASRENSDAMVDVMRHMELMLGNWRTTAPKDLPIEAIFYTAGPYEVAGLKGAQLIQRDYNLVTGNVVPIVRFATDPSVPPFSYREADQAIVR